MDIQIDQHTLERDEERSTHEEEIKDGRKKCRSCIMPIEILDASKHLNLERLLPVKHGSAPEAV